MLEFIKSIENGFICLSGGAAGSDDLFSNLFKNTVVISFKGATINGHCAFRYNVPNEDMEVVKDFMSKLAIKIGRKLSKNFYKYQCRDLYQVIGRNYKVDFVVAVGIADDNGVVKGGTAYATEVAKLKTIPIILINPNTGKLSVWKNNQWSCCSLEETRLIVHNNKNKTLFSGVGTRDLTPETKKLVKSVIIQLFTK